MCSAIGFSDITVDDSNNLMSFELPDYEPNQSDKSSNRNKVHVGSDEFSHLKEYDMNELCDRVNLVGVKPYH